MKRALLLVGVIGCGPAAAPVVKQVAPVVEAPPAPLGEALPVTVLADEGEIVSQLAVDGDDVYWLAGSALQRQRGADLETIADPVDWFAVDHGDVFVVYEDQIARIDGTVLGTIESAGRLAVDDTRIYAASLHGISAIPRAGGAEEVVAADAGKVISIAADGGAVYWADAGEREHVPDKELCKTPNASARSCKARPARLGTIRRAIDGKVETLADDVYFPVAVGVAGEHVYWSAEDGEAIERAPKGGGDAVVGLGGRGLAMAVDALGAVVVTTDGLVIEVPADGGAARVRATDLGFLGVTIALAPDAIYVSDFGREQILRYPRGPARVTVLATAHGHFQDLALDGDDVYALDIDASEGRADRVLKVPKRGGHREVVGTYGTKGAHLAVANGEVVVLEYERLYAGGAELELGDTAIDVATDGHDVYLLSSDGSVTATPIGLDERREVYRPTRSIAIPMRLPAGKVAIDGDAVYVAGESVGELGRIQQDQRDVVASGVRDFAVRGDTLVTLGDDGLVLRPALTVLAPSFDGDVELALDADELWWWRNARTNGTPQLVRVPLDGGPEEVVMNVGASIAADDDAVYLAVGSVLLRLATRP